MLVKEIIGLVDTMTENSIPIKTKLIWINQIMNQFYSDYPFPERVHIFTVSPGQELYKLPDNCFENRIVALTINNKSYPYLPSDSNSEVCGKFYTFVSGLLMIHPIITSNAQAILRYHPSPKQLTEDDMCIEPEFPSDFHEMLVFGCASRVVKSKPETMNLSAVFDNDFNALAAKAQRVLVKPRQNKVVVTRPWS